MILELTGPKPRLHAVYKWLHQYGYAPRIAESCVDVDLPEMEDLHALQFELSGEFSDLFTEILNT